MASGRVTATRSNEDAHVCRPPKREPGHKTGLLWTCPDCWSELLYRPVASSELGGRVINLWVRFWEPPHTVMTPLRASKRAAKTEPAVDLVGQLRAAVDRARERRKGEAR